MPNSNEIPARYRCPITKQIMIDPVFTAGGYTYEREAIAQWLQTNDKDPITNSRLKRKTLTENHDKRSEILAFLDNHPELYDGDEVYLPQSWMRRCAIAIKRNQPRAVQRWLDKDRRLLTSKLDGSNTALGLACEFSSPELVDTLLKILRQREQPIKHPLVFSPPAAPPCVRFLANAEPILNVNPVEEFLRFVAQGEQDKAEAMLKNDRTLALRPGDVTDLSKRTFKSITGFQYAVWALDWHMWTMIQKYLPLEAARTQAQAFETGSWIREQGVHAEWLLGKLINAYQTALNLYEQSKWVEGDVAWVEQVGGAQRLLPAHVVNEYCHPTRIFYPLPDFKAALSLPRSRIIDQGEWFTALFDGGTLGNKFAVYRAGAVSVCLARGDGRVDRGDAILVLGRMDNKSVRALNSIRTAQRGALVAELTVGRKLTAQ